MHRSSGIIERVHFAALVFAVAGYVVGLSLGESGLVSVLVASLYVVMRSGLFSSAVLRMRCISTADLSM